MTNYGYIGLGMMGSAMAQHLLASGASVSVFDLDPAAVEGAVAQGATAAGSPSAVAAASDIVSICVPAAHHIAAVLTGDGGIAEGAHDGLTILIHSTVLPETITEARDAAAAWGATVFDVPVAGGRDAALIGELALFVGGADEMNPPTKALLEIYGSKIIETGDIGSGAAVKIAVNTMTYMQQAAARIAFALVGQHDTDPEGLLEAWRHTGQLGKLTEQFLPVITLPQDFIDEHLKSGLEGTSGIAEKDIELSMALGDLPAELSAVLDSLLGAQRAINRIA